MVTNGIIRPVGRDKKGNRQGGHPLAPQGSLRGESPSAGQEEFMGKLKQRLCSLLLCGAMLASLCPAALAEDGGIYYLDEKGEK